MTAEKRGYIAGYDIYSSRNEKVLYAVIWSAIMILPVVLELWNLISDSRFDWDFVLRWWSGMLPLILLFIIHNQFLIPNLMKRGKIGAYILSILILTAAYAGYVLLSMPPKPPMPHMNPMPPIHHMPVHKRPLPFHFHLLFKLMLAVLTMGLNVAISLLFTYTRDQAARKELENRRLQEELKYLKQQISPHFLMNVLNNIHEMTEENVEEAQDMILELSYLLRYVLYESEKDMTTLRSECLFISSYISLMKQRYVEDIVTVAAEMPESISEDISIPPLLFISFIENAFKHGISYNSKSFIDISLHEKDGEIFFLCRNSIPAERNNAAIGGVGLSNVKRRLNLLYGNSYSLNISTDNNIYSVNLTIPSDEHKMHDN